MTSEMVQAMQDLMRSGRESMHVALPGTIVSYDTASGLCQVQPIGTMRKPDGTAINYPIIAGVPICAPAGIVVPVAVGTVCLLVICDSDIAGWLSGKTAAQSMPHSLQNAVCIPELRRTPAALQAYANTNHCVAIEGNLYVSGGITSAGNVSAPNID